SLAEPPEPNAYYIHSQIPFPLNNLVIRYSGSPDALIPQVRRAITEVNRALPIDGGIKLSEHIGLSLAQERLVARLGTFFRLLSLLLACVRVLRVLSFPRPRRTDA